MNMHDLDLEFDEKSDIAHLIEVEALGIEAGTIDCEEAMKLFCENSRPLEN